MNDARYHLQDANFIRQRDYIPICNSHDQLWDENMHGVLWGQRRCLKLSGQVRLSEMLGAWKIREDRSGLNALNYVPSKCIC